MDIVILAGGKCDDALREVSGAEFRCDLPIFGRPILDIVLEAVEGIGEPILVGGPEGRHPRQLPGGKTFIESLTRGMSAASTEEILIISADLPCINRGAIEDFLKQCDPNAGLNYPIITIEDCEKAFPGMKRTTLRLREGRFTGGNIALVRRSLMDRAMPVMERAYAARKKPMKLAGIVGIGTISRLVFGVLFPRTLTIAALEKSVGRFLQARLHGVITHHAEIGADLDNSEQYQALVSGGQTTK